MSASLPAHPDLEHLRREAKTLLRRLREGDNHARRRFEIHASGLSTSLGTAQLVVAREHGFPSWGRLKAVVANMAASGVRYDEIGRGYSAYRQADPRINSTLQSALGDARTVVNVGAGTGSYEPTDRPVIPVEPSTAMALQRDPALTPAVLGVAESLPLADQSADAAMAVLTMHHWADLTRGLSELRRVARRRIVLLTIDVPAEVDRWLFRDYAPEIADYDRRAFPAISDLVTTLGGATRVLPVPVPADCTDGMLLAFWSRPEAVLDPLARAATSGFALLDEARQTEVVDQLTRDLASGEWDRCNGSLRHLDELDVGLRLVIADVT